MTKQMLSADSDHWYILNPDESCQLANSSCWHLSMTYIYQCHIWLEIAFVLYAFDALAACTRADEHHSVHAFWEEVCTGDIFFSLTYTDQYWMLFCINTFHHVYHDVGYLHAFNALICHAIMLVTVTQSLFAAKASV